MFLSYLHLFSVWCCSCMGGDAVVLHAW